MSKLSKQTYIKICIAVALVAIGVLGRTLPHFWNFTPIIAIAMVSGTYLGFRYAIAVVFASMLIGDIFLGFYGLPMMLSVYGSFFIAGAIGLFVKKYKYPEVIAVGSLLSSIIFFFTTNTAVWIFSPLYPETISGLMLSYTMGIPFFKYAVVGDMVYTLSLFAIFELAIFVCKKFSAYSKESIAIN